MSESVVLPQPVAHLCEWDGEWWQYHDERSPMPDEWDDEVPRITPLYTADQLRAAVLAERERIFMLALEWSAARVPEFGGNALGNFAAAIRGAR